MNRSGAAAVLLFACLAPTACAPGSGASQRTPEPAPASTSDPVVSDTSARGRAAFGCALERGLDGADAATRHYIHLGSHALFVAALEDDHDYATAADLWNASDAVSVDDDEQRARSELLDVCATAGLDGTAGIPELRSYMCAMTADLASERPTIASFGPASTTARPGDPRRDDVRFVGIAQFLLSRVEDPELLDFPDIYVSMDDGDRSYGDALDQLEEFCA